MLVPQPDWFERRSNVFWRSIGFQKNLRNSKSILKSKSCWFQPDNIIKIMEIIGHLEDLDGNVYNYVNSWEDGFETGYLLMKEENGIKLYTAVYLWMTEKKITFSIKNYLWTRNP